MEHGNMISTPAFIGPVEIKNRVFVSSMCLYYSDGDGNVTDKMMAFFEKRAKSGIGAFIIPANPHGKNKKARGSLADDSRIGQWKPLTGMLHSYGAKAFCQIHPAGIQFGRKDFTESPFDLDIEELKELIESYALGALRAKRAGFDGVEIHGAHGHEIALLLSELLNTRADRYGGSLENCARTATEMIRRIKELCSADFPVILRVSGEERIPGGREIDGTVELCMLAKDAGVDAIHVSCGMPESEEWECPPSEVEQGHLKWMGKHLKERLDIPVIVVGRIVDWHVGERMIEEGCADFIAVARAVLADGNWMRSVDDNEYPVHLCIGCNQGCRTRREQTKTFCTCLQNPMTGREENIDIARDAEGRKVCVIGAGVAGLEAANVLSKRGSSVTVYDESEQIGGLFRWAAKAPGKQEYENVLRYYEKILKKREVHFVLDQRVLNTPEGAWNLVVVATGSLPRIPPVGIENATVRTAVEILKDENLLAGSFVVVGDGLVGYEIADYLSARGKNVVLAGNDPRDPEALQGIARWHFMRQRLAENNVRILRGRTVRRIDAEGFFIVGADGVENRIDGKYEYVLACGYVQETGLADKIAAEGWNVLTVGGGVNGGDAMDAIHDAFNKTLSVAF